MTDAIRNATAIRYDRLEERLLSSGERGAIRLRIPVCKSQFDRYRCYVYGADAESASWTGYKK